MRFLSGRANPSTEHDSVVILLRSFLRAFEGFTESPFPNAVIVVVGGVEGKIQFRYNFSQKTATTTTAAKVVEGKTRFFITSQRLGSLHENSIPALLTHLEQLSRGTRN
jgi:hypothetical protein